MYDSLIQKLADGNKDLDIPPLDPVEIKDFVIKTQEIGPFKINCTFDNSTFHGFRNTTTKKFTGFLKDFDGKENEIMLFTPKYVMNGIYDARGTLFGLPLQISGNSTVILLNVHTRLRFISRKLEKNGKIYARIDNMKIKAEFDRMRLEFPESREDNRIVEEIAYEYVNSNWKQVYSILKSSIYKTFTKIWQDIFNQITTKIPYEEFFIDE
ncbi:protein takeout-like [Phlebotomus argentipes]|uniref:protein takeout-like n=1 Tax=Phlebotomus argentipes TaxID=94469 RepID=UPI002892BE67|nr:protein takeout-like [Phlebotomus argentipes]